MSNPRYGFSIPLELRFHSDDEKCWEVRKPIRYLSAYTQQAYTVEKGFRFDGPSVPRLPVAYLFFGGRAFLASLIHDYIYEHGLGTKMVADYIFAEIMDMTGEPGWRQFFMHAAVQVFGRGNFEEADGTPKAGFVLSQGD